MFKDLGENVTFYRVESATVMHLLQFLLLFFQGTSCNFSMEKLSILSKSYVQISQSGLNVVMKCCTSYLIL